MPTARDVLNELRWRDDRDFAQVEGEGGLYLKKEYQAGPGDSHPNEEFCRKAAPLFGQRIVDVIEGRGDSGKLTGEK